MLATVSLSSWYDDCPTGLELAEQVLHKLAALPELKGRVHAHSQVVQVARHGARKGDLLGKPERAAHPFRLLKRGAYSWQLRKRGR
jgi:hypothetical protein